MVSIPVRPSTRVTLTSLTGALAASIATLQLFSDNVGIGVRNVAVDGGDGDFSVVR